MKNKLNKVITSIILIMLFISVMSIKVSANFITEINSNASFGVIDRSLETYGHELHYANYSGGTYMLFCTQFGIKSPTGKEYSYNDEFIVQYKLNIPEYEHMAEMIYFGYGMKYGMGLPNSLDAEQDACCTQNYVWEYMKNNIDGSLNIPSRDSWNANYMSSMIYDIWYTETINNYNKYHSKVSFNELTSQINIGDEKILTDTNNVLSNYDNFNQTIQGVIFSHQRGSNDLKISVSKDTDSNNIDSKNIRFNSKDYSIYSLTPNGKVFSKNTMSNYIHFKFTSGTVQNLIFSNYLNPSSFSLSIEIQSGSIFVNKTNNIGNPISGCCFEIYEDENCNKKIDSGISDANGEILFNNLKPGIYFIKEINASNGYLNNKEIKKVEVFNNKTSSVVFKNDEPTGTIKIIKQDSETGDIPQGDGTFKGAKYQLTASEDIYNKSATNRIYQKGQIVAMREIDEYGKTEDITNLPLGKYILKEIEAPIGYLLDTNEYEIDLKYKDQNTNIISEVIVSKEKVKKAQVHIFKYGIKSNSGQIQGIEGVKFKIKLYQDLLKYEKEKTNEKENKTENKTENETKTYTLTTDKYGNAYTDEELAFGKYMIEEIENPDGFLKLEEPVIFEINGEENNMKEILIKNESPAGKLIINKKIELSENSKYPLEYFSDLSKIEFKLTAKENIIDPIDKEIIYKQGSAIGIYNLDKNGKLVIENLPMGVYELEEIKTLEGLTLNNEKFEIRFEQKDDTTKEYKIEKDIINKTEEKEPVIENPKTGDNINFVFLGIIMGLSAIGLITANIYNYFKRKI